MTGIQASEERARGAATLEIRDLKVQYGNVAVAREVSVTVGAGEIVGLIGPNGAGKSSVIAAIVGELRPATGTIYMSGEDITKVRSFRRARAGMIRTFQTARVFEGMTVFEGLLTAARGQAGASFSQTVFHPSRQRGAELEATEAIWALLDRFSLEHVANMFGSELSGGQRRLVELLMALVRKPVVLLLDEPMVGVSRLLVPELVAEIRNQGAQGVGVLVVEHALDVIEALCDRVVVLAAGTVIAEGTYASVTADAAVRKAYLA
jgi:branched-chain amino acid transport system ATP-binding protein